MTLFKSEHRSLKYSSMAGDLQSCRYRTGGRRSNDDGYRDENHLEYGCYKEELLYERGFDCHAPVSGTMIPDDTNPPKRARTCSSSSALQFRKQPSRSKSRISYSSSRRACLRMEELQCIKRELKVIKNQIDKLLNSLELMDTGNSDASGVSEGSPPHSPHSSSVSSMGGSSCSPLRSSRVFKERQSLQSRGTRHEARQVKHESDLYYI